MRAGLPLTADRQAMKAAWRAAVAGAGGQEAVAAFGVCRQQRASDLGNPHQPCLPRVDEVAAIEALTHGNRSHPALTRLLASLAGYALVKLPSAVAGCPMDWHDHAAQLARESGEVLGALAESLRGDGVITPAEALRLAREIADVQRILAELSAALEEVAEGP